MPNIKTGDILMVSSNHWLSKQIQKVTKSKWNHAGIFVSLWGELFIIEAEIRGIQLTKWSDPKYNSGNPANKKLLVLSPKIPLNEKQIAMFMLPMVGVTPYDFSSLLLYQIIYNYTGLWIGRKRSKAKKRFYCSEFVAYLYNRFLRYYKDSWWKTSPKMILSEEKHFNKYKLNY